MSRSPLVFHFMTVSTEAGSTVDRRSERTNDAEKANVGTGEGWVKNDAGHVFVRFGQSFFESSRLSTSTCYAAEL
ncbi:hypothetical protein AC579_5601 [Pseudocercospora musae]|uniref:Uncharacterized protein n=1 Tax=Pseudocercospora musae TaxID=113226 RepID=A0A139INS9_9PEZI|nr:hypothetical protein AC579_5601 [Pseudocercospora musae]